MDLYRLYTAEGGIEVRIQPKIVPVLVTAMLFSSTVPSWAQTAHIADTNAMMQAIQHKASTENADRTAVSRVLQSSQAREVANRFGLDLTGAENAVASLQGADLERAASSARAAEVELSGGATTVVISTTVLLLLLILIVLIAK